jgi:hypothetical protein
LAQNALHPSIKNKTLNELCQIYLGLEVIKSLVQLKTQVPNPKFQEQGLFYDPSWDLRLGI